MKHTEGEKIVLGVRLYRKEGTLHWKAPDGMTTRQAVAYLEHGPEMAEVIKDYRACLLSMAQDNDDSPDDFVKGIDALLAKLDKEVA